MIGHKGANYEWSERESEGERGERGREREGERERIAEVPLTVRLVITDPPIEDEATETTVIIGCSPSIHSLFQVEPSQPIHFHCLVNGRPMPTVVYSWLPLNTTADSGDVRNDP